ncbi:DUF1016 domain-containing protein, partial [Bacteroides sp. 51]|uniref:DUF1016 domain-containing protein n=1 Tax=Bacteroides sp. 51 TaxID=2302938 RepID=UPI0013D2242E
KTEEEKVFYILLAYKEKLKYRELRRQIESSVYIAGVVGSIDILVRIVFAVGHGKHFHVFHPLDN